MKTLSRGICATVSLVFAATLLGGAPASASAEIGSYDGAPDAAYVRDNNLELKSDGLYYAPGDTDPTIDEMETTIVDPDEGMISPMAVPVACNGRLDYYRLVTTSNAWNCFRNKGSYSKTAGYWNNIKGQCPGNNTGRFHYYHSGLNGWAWTKKRVGTSDHSKCYWFEKNQSFAVATIEIS